MFLGSCPQACGESYLRTASSFGPYFPCRPWLVSGAACRLPPGPRRHKTCHVDRASMGARVLTGYVVSRVLRFLNVLNDVWTVIDSNIRHIVESLETGNLAQYHRFKATGSVSRHIPRHLKCFKHKNLPFFLLNQLTYLCIKPIGFLL